MFYETGSRREVDQRQHHGRADPSHQRVRRHRLPRQLRRPLEPAQG